VQLNFYPILSFELRRHQCRHSAEDFDAFLKAELRRWPPLVKQLGIKGE